MDLNELAKAVTLFEGKKISTNIAQVKEMLRCLRDVMNGLELSELAETMSNLLQLEKKAKKKRAKK